VIFGNLPEHNSTIAKPNRSRSYFLDFSCHFLLEMRFLPMALTDNFAVHCGHMPFKII
jgi:hypothetical protein